MVKKFNMIEYFYLLFATDRMIIKQAGFIEVFVNNESNSPVYYDNMTVNHRGGANSDVLEVNAYYPHGALIPDLSLQNYALFSSPLNFFKFSAKELQAELELNWLDFHARTYSPLKGRFLQPDPHAENYFSTSPYAYALNNPVNYIDPDGRDPIYSKNFWGNTRLIGDDGLENDMSYLVRGSVARDVKTATKSGEFFTGSLAESNNVFHIPTGNILNDVQQSVTNTLNSGTSADTRVEHGAHTIIGDNNARHWDSGNPRQTSTAVYANGNTIVTSTWSVTPFKIGGKIQPGGNANSLGFIWHTHPNSSTPSAADMNAVSNWRSHGFTGNTFLINVNNSKVVFFNERGTLIRVNYNDFLRMGNRR